MFQKNNTTLSITRYFLIFCLVLSSIHFNFCSKQSIKEYSTAVLTTKGQPTKALLSLLDLLQIKHDGTLKTIVEQTQKAWLRKPGQERWDLEERYENLKDNIISLLGQLNLLDEILPTQLYYDYAIMLGASVGRVRSRLSYLLEQWQKGVRFDTLVVLSGERPLHEELECEAILLDTSSYPFAKKGWKFKGALPTNEIEMMKFVLDQTELPQGFEKVTIVFISVPMLEGPDGMQRRPTTKDTNLKWLDEKPKAGTGLAISNQPYVQYQDAVLKAVMPNEFIIETVGYADTDTTNITVHLDNLARILYQEEQRKKQC